MTETARRPRILMLTSTLPRWEGDSEPRFVLDLAKNLSAHFDIELLAPHTHGAMRSEMLEGVPVTRFRYWIPNWQSVAYQGGISCRLRENPARILQLPLFLSSLAWHTAHRVRREPRIDLIHAHWLIPQGLVAILVRRLAGRNIPIVATSHGGDLFGLRGRFWNSLKRKVLRQSDVVTVVSNAMAATVQEITGHVTAVVIPMGTNLTCRFVPPVQPRTGPIGSLVFVGRLVEKKGVRYLLEAMTTVVQKHPEIRLKVVGHGPLRPALEVDVERLGLGNVVSFVGAIPHQELAVHYQEADIAVFPFVEAASGDQEGFGLVMVEAMGCGCAVIACDLPAVRDVVQDMETGIIVAPGNVAALAHAITSLLESRATALTMSERGRAYALENFDWSATSEKFRKIFGILVECAAGGADGVKSLPQRHPGSSSVPEETRPIRRGHAAMDLRSRDAKARKIEELLNLAPGGDALKILEIGTGSGGIANYFGRHPSRHCDVDAVDVSDTRQVHDGYRFFHVNDVELPCPDHLYDIVISNHVIEHVGDINAQRRHLVEMRRVLKPEGKGYLAVPNRWQVVEPHYQVAFLSWLPEAWRSPYLRMRGRGVDYDCRPLTVSLLENLLHDVGFKFHQEHGTALRLSYEIEQPDALIYRAVFSHLPDGVYKSLRRAFPTLIYILYPTQGT